MCDPQDISNIEEYEFLKCLGIAFKDVLVADLVDYSSAPDYESGSSYNEGDVVVYNGVYKKATQNTSQEPNGSDWINAPKFTTDCYETLWCNYLARYLALTVIKDKLQTWATHITEQGVIVKSGDSYEAARQSEVEALAASIDVKIGKGYELMDYYMRHNNDSGCFDLYRGLGNLYCDDCNQLVPCGCNCVENKRSKHKYIIG